MELGIVMPSALTIRNSSMDRPTAKIGKMIRVITGHAVLNSMSGRPTNTPTPTLPILASNPDM